MDLHWFSTAMLWMVSPGYSNITWPRDLIAEYQFRRNCGPLFTAMPLMRRGM